jgi:hypothetical protein
MMPEENLETLDCSLKFILFCVYKAQNKANGTIESDLTLGVLLWKLDFKRIAQRYRAYQTTGHSLSET